MQHPPNAPDVEILKSLASVLARLLEPQTPDLAGGEERPSFTDLVSDVRAEVSPFTGHPLTTEDEHLQEVYVACLLAFAEVDAPIRAEETTFIRDLILGLGDKPWGTYLALSRQLGKEELRYLRSVTDARPIRSNLIIDLMMLGLCDGPIDLSEARLIGELARLVDLELRDLEALAKVVTALCAGNLIDVSAAIRNLTRGAGEFVQIDHLQRRVTASGPIPIRNTVHLQGVNTFRGAQLVFEKGAVLKVDRDAVVTFLDCELTNPEIDCEDAELFSLNYCKIQWIDRAYTKHEPVISIVSEKFSAKNCSVSTIGNSQISYHVFYIKSEKIEVIDCFFDTENHSSSHEYLWIDESIAHETRMWRFSGVITKNNRDVFANLHSKVNNFFVPMGGDIVIEKCNFLRTYR